MKTKKQKPKQQKKARKTKLKTNHFNDWLKNDYHDCYLAIMQCWLGCDVDLILHYMADAFAAGRASSE